jgi:hypothetical protein
MNRRSMVLFFLVIAAWVAIIYAAGAAPFMPPGATQYAPVLAQKQKDNWAGVPTPWTLAGLVEQESCASLKSKGCWNPHAELKTSREYGFGLGQITIAYKTDGTERFNEFTTLQKQYASLRQWKWENRYDPGYQLTAIIEMVRALWIKTPPSKGDDTHWAFALVSYNGGLGGLLQDRRFCANSSGCDPELWFGNIETHSLKSKAPQKAYGGQSWYSITRGYVKNVLTLRRAKYQPFWTGTGEHPSSAPGESSNERKPRPQERTILERLRWW